MKKTEKKSKKGMSKGLVVALSVLLAVAVIAAVLVLGVYRGMHMYLKAELGEGAPDASKFFKSKTEASYKTEPDVSLKKEGVCLATVTDGDISRPVLIVVRDTMAPQAEGKSTNITIDDKTLKPEAALTEIKEASEYTVEWKTEPKYGTAGTYDCEIVLTDAKENTQTVKTTVYVLGAIDVLNHEAGTPQPTLKDFMVVERDDAELLTDLSKIEWNKLGPNSVQIKVDGKTYTSILKIVDTTAPELDTVPVAALPDGELKADDFVLSYTDATEVSFALKEKPNLAEKGSCDCTVVATDEGKNVTEATCRVIVCDALAEFEASYDMLSESEVLKQIGSEYSGYKMETEPFELNSLGAHEVIFTKGEESITVGVTVKDTTAPTADGIKFACATGYACDAINFVENIKDITAVTASFKTEPDWSKEGEQSVTIILKDRAGNTSEITATADISEDKTAPVIYAADRYCYIGETVDYMDGVYAVDNADPEPEITVDSSKVDANKAGEYELSFTAKDEKGNESTKTVKIAFMEAVVTQSELDTELDKIIKTIIKDGMSKQEKAQAVFEYVNTSITCTASSEETDLRVAALMGIAEQSGDEFTAYAVSLALLQRLELDVKTVGADGHYWCLVNLGSGWYHFDACNQCPKDFKCFMKTSEQLNEASSTYWQFDEENLPKLETIHYAMENK